MSDMCPWGHNGPKPTDGDHCGHKRGKVQYCCWCGKTLDKWTYVKYDVTEHGPELRDPKHSRKKVSE